MFVGSRKEYSLLKNVNTVGGKELKLFDFSKRWIKLIIVITLLVALALAVVGCADFLGTTPETDEPVDEEVSPPTTVNTNDKAILVVYEHLLSQAGTYQAKVYLADFYTTSEDGWSAESEFLKDGTNIWYVVVDMTDTRVWTDRHHWQQASWLVFGTGEVIPSNRYQANALRIEADLQELSLQSEL